MLSSGGNSAADTINPPIFVTYSNDCQPTIHIRAPPALSEATAQAEVLLFHPH